MWLERPGNRIGAQGFLLRWLEALRSACAWRNFCRVRGRCMGRPPGLSKWSPPYAIRLSLLCPHQPEQKFRLLYMFVYIRGVIALPLVFQGACVPMRLPNNGGVIRYSMPVSSHTRRKSELFLTAASFQNRP